MYDQLLSALAQLTPAEWLHVGRVTVDASVVGWAVRAFLQKLTWTASPMFYFTRGLSQRGGGQAVALGWLALLTDLILVATMVQPVAGLRWKSVEAEEADKSTEAKTQRIRRRPDAAWRRTRNNPGKSRVRLGNPPASGKA